ncbi:RagB/SusD family nutrient uptake outer membrane protein [Cellulophaga sp. BC115SP]|uniref:RagB/SusD family nutrient uptake outer membrane protein n=1 Tax=Cellulophaga sp. BC115SP TaxID=2683263 RepID=UPI0014131D55|nr:RagB/SusD family nutrient uptake outer membrane protein [Cellulophaga sp. BC115SP]NBB31379.1 RagB/SusD family nutrient uptake outer membrane protein [Cellulophaga sp. BC115SP]
MKFSKISIAIAAVCLNLSACKQLDLAPTDRFSELTFWKIDQNVNNALYNNYSLMYDSNSYFYLDATSDNAYSPQGNSSGNADAITSGSFTATLPRFRNDWGNYYKLIKSCNLFLENVDKNTTLPAATIARLKAETRFLRAFAHFNLTKWYGDVPLLDRDLTIEEAQVVARKPKAEVVNFVVSELEAAIADLPSKDAIPASENGRITKAAALALQARVLLYQGNKMAEVASICEKLMNNQATYGKYSLHESYSALFNDPAANKVNNETILALQYVPAVRTWGEFFDFAPRSVGARTNNLGATQELVDSYRMLNGKKITDPASGYNENDPYINRDPRLTATIVYDGYNWVNPNGSTKKIYIKPGTDPVQPGADEYSTSGQGSATGYYWRKYFDPTALASFASGSNLHLIRYAEVLLTYAEAKNSLGQMDASVWDKTIKALRMRAGFTDPAALNYPGTGDMTNIIRDERRVELAMEGLRTDDIRRWKIAEVVLNGYAHGAKFSDPTIDRGYIRAQRRQFDASKHYLWPIPASELSLNKNLTQNPGY